MNRPQASRPITLNDILAGAAAPTPRPAAVQPQYNTPETFANQPQEINYFNPNLLPVMTKPGGWWGW